MGYGLRILGRGLSWDALWLRIMGRRGPVSRRESFEMHPSDLGMDGGSRWSRRLGPKTAYPGTRAALGSLVAARLGPPQPSLGTRASQVGIKDLGIVESQARLCILGHDMSILGRT